MNQSFVPKLKGVNTVDDRDLALMVYHLYVGEADKLGSPSGVVEAVPVSLAPLATATASPAPGKVPATAGTGAAGTNKPAPVRSPAPVKSPAATKN
jgi:hypothetical protein